QETGERRQETEEPENRKRPHRRDAGNAELTPYIISKDNRHARLPVHCRQAGMTVEVFYFF
ncbi:MAG: hypothetical protein U9P80_07770, partial [Thermodesulfobacteriota bacterium]|nr:hypothetical protein [Thermodesulfobacteriota bacterium]